MEINERSGLEEKVNDSERKPRNYWQDFENVKKELDKIIEEEGRFPTHNQLSKRNSSLFVAMRLYFGGVRKFKKLYPLEITKKKENPLKDINCMMEELRSLVENLGRFPNQKEMGNRLSRAASKYHCGITRVRELLGYGLSTRPQKYWKDLDNVKKELELIIEELGQFPTSQWMRVKNGSLLSAIEKYHGGIRKVRELYRVDNPHKEVNYWQDFENVKRELEPIIEKLGRFPTQKEMGARLPYAVKYHGGITKVRELLGYGHSIRPSNYWKDFDNVKKELEPIIEELGRFPIPKEVRSRNENLRNAIYRCHGGYIAVKIKMGYADQELDVLKQLMEEITK